MKKNSQANLLPIAVTVVAGVLLVLWNTRHIEDLTDRVPLQSDQQTIELDENAPIDLQGRLIPLRDVPPAPWSGTWPGFRGGRYDAIFSNDQITLSRSWPKEGPPILWSISLGEGYAGAAVYQGRVYVLDYDQENDADTLRCLSLEDGQDFWRYTYPIKIKRNHGMSRSVPRVNETYVVTVGPKGQVNCLDAKKGHIIWALDLVRQYGTKIPLWYASQCPLIDDKNRVILAPAGPNVMMMAVECETGNVVWKTPNPQGWKMTHSSIVPMEFEGQQMYVYCASGGVVGVSAETGELLWDTTAWMIRTATVPSPVPVGEGRLFCTGGYNAGSAMLKLTKAGNAYKVETLFRLEPAIFGAEQHTPIFYQGHLYGVRQEDEQMVCLDLNGKVVWESGRQYQFGVGPGSGPFMIANGIIYALNNKGFLRMIAATSSGYQQLAEAHVLEDPHDPWGPMALADGRLILRDLTRMVCLDIRAKQADSEQPTQ